MKYRFISDDHRHKVETNSLKALDKVKEAGILMADGHTYQVLKEPNGLHIVGKGFGATIKQAWLTT